MRPGRAIYARERRSDPVSRDRDRGVRPHARPDPPPAGPRTRLLLTQPLVRSYDRARTLVLGNVARATHGETVDEVLGSGDARRAFQRFALSQGPLTFVQARHRRGFDVHPPGRRRRHPLDRGRLAVRRGSGRPDVHLRPVGRAQPRDRTSGRRRRHGWVGTHGARMPSGSHNVRASYRKGLGRRGQPQAADSSPSRWTGRSASRRPPTRCPRSGGADPEPAERGPALHPGLDTHPGPRGVPARLRGLRLGPSPGSPAPTHACSRSGRVARSWSASAVPTAGEAADSTVKHLTSALRSIGRPPRPGGGGPGRDRPLPARPAAGDRAGARRRRGETARGRRSARAVRHRAPRPRRTRPRVRGHRGRGVGGGRGRRWTSTSCTGSGRRTAAEPGLAADPARVGPTAHPSAPSCSRCRELPLEVTP